MDTALELKRQRNREAQARYRARHPERKLYFRQWVARNKDRVRASQAKYASKDSNKRREAERRKLPANRERIQASRDRYIAKYPEKNKESKRQWALRNRDKVLATRKLYRSKYPERIRESELRSRAKHPRKPFWWREDYQKNKSKVNARNKAWMEKNKEKMLPKLRAKWRRNLVKNRERKNVQKAALRKANPERFRAYNRKSQKRCWTKRQEYARNYYQRNKERLKAHARDLYQANKPRFFVHAQKRRALQLKATVNLKSIREFIRRIKSKPTAKCYYCSDVVSTKAIHFDHVIPLSKGGSHSVENLCVSCATCNLTKNASLIKTWFKAGQQILNL